MHPVVLLLVCFCISGCLQGYTFCSYGSQRVNDLRCTGMRMKVHLAVNRECFYVGYLACCHCISPQWCQEPHCGALFPALGCHVEQPFLPAWLAGRHDGLSVLVHCQRSVAVTTHTLQSAAIAAADSAAFWHTCQERMSRSLRQEPQASVTQISLGLWLFHIDVTLSLALLGS